MPEILVNRLSEYYIKKRLPYSNETTEASFSLHVASILGEKYLQFVLTTKTNVVNAYANCLRYLQTVSPNYFNCSFVQSSSPGYSLCKLLSKGMFRSVFNKLNVLLF